MTLIEWFDKTYRADRTNRTPGERKRLIESRISDMKLYGNTLISKHDSVTGKAEYYS